MEIPTRASPRDSAGHRLGRATQVGLQLGHLDNVARGRNHHLNITLADKLDLWALGITSAGTASAAKDSGCAWESQPQALCVAYILLRLLGGDLMSPRLAARVLDAIDDLPASLQPEAFSLAARCLAFGVPPATLAKVRALLPRHPAAWVAWQALAPTEALPHLANALLRADPDAAQALAVAAMRERAGALVLAQVGPTLSVPQQEAVGRVLRAALNGAFARDRPLRKQVDKLWPQRLR